MSWIEALKAGDSVIIHNRYGDAVHTVDKVTPTGRIKVGNVYYNKRGVEMGGSDWITNVLQEATPEAMQKIVETQTIKKALGLARNVPKITYEQALKLIDLLEDKGTNGQ